MIEVADLLARPGSDAATQFAELVCRATGAEDAFVWVIPDDAGTSGFTVRQNGVRFDGVPDVAVQWIGGIDGGAIHLSDTAPITDLPPGGTSIAAAGRANGAVFALVAVAGAFDDEERRRFRDLAHFAPAVLSKGGLTAQALTGVTRAAADLLNGEAARLRQFGDASPDIFWIREAATLAIEYVSPAFEAIYGASLETAFTGRDGDGSERIFREDRVAALASMDRARRGEVGVVEFRIRRESDAGVRWLRATDFPLRSADGRIERLGRISRDITEAKLAAEESRTLQLELQHRVRNALAVIRALVRRTADVSETVDELASHLDGRINAFARVQAALSRHPTAGLDLEHLVADELLAYSAHEGRRVVMKGPRISLTPKAAETLGLIVHELATNAVKHGVLGMTTGRVRVIWTIQPAHDIPRLVIDWVERGKGIATDPPVHRGFGTELLEKTLPYELNGSATVRYEKQGLHCVIEVPLTALVLARGD